MHIPYLSVFDVALSDRPRLEASRNMRPFEPSAGALVRADSFTKPCWQAYATS